MMKDYLSISEMAKLHKISRQTLIYYDKIGLFKPVHIGANGYRYYSPYQIPFLREICFLKSIGVNLKDIKGNIRNRSVDTTVSLLKYQKEYINKKIRELATISEDIDEKLNIYANAEYYKSKSNKPIIQEFPVREVVFMPFEKELCKRELHLSLMKIWNIIINYGMLPSKGFGTIIKKNKLKELNIFDGAGSFIVLPFIGSKIQNLITLPPGKYACMYKYGMSYETEHLYKLIKWIEDNNYKIVGDIVDFCLLDTTFYDDKRSVDFCQIQIPVEKIN